MEAEAKSNDTRIMKGIDGSIIPFLSVLLILMLLADWVFNSFMYKPDQLQLNTHTAVYEKTHEQHRQQTVMSNERGTKVQWAETCIGVYDLQTRQTKQQGTTMVIQSPAKKIIE
jgi:hypothetical protein